MRKNTPPQRTLCTTINGVTDEVADGYVLPPAQDDAEITEAAAEVAIDYGSPLSQDDAEAHIHNSDALTAFRHISAKFYSIYNDKKLEGRSSFKAIKRTFELLSLRPEISFVALPEFNFLVNREKKTALFTRLCFFSSKQTEHVYDEEKRGIRVKRTMKAIGSFFHNGGAYKDYTLAISVGTAAHETGVFLRKKDGLGRAYDVVHFNPNANQQMVNFAELVKELPRSSTINGYCDPDNNINGQCSYLVWSEFILLLLHDFDPFKDRNLLKYCRKTKMCIEE